MKYYEVNYNYINIKNGQGKQLMSIIDYNPNDYIKMLNKRDELYNFLLVNSKEITEEEYLYHKRKLK